MLIRRRMIAAPRRCYRRCLSGWSSGSILGTTTMSGSLIRDLQEDLKQENELRTKGIGETLQNYIHRAELSHMESPEADERFVKALDAKLDDLFARIPLPDDPMRAALARTDEELKEEAAAELVKEAVREIYWRKLDAKQAEELRLKRAQERLAKQGMRQYFGEMREEEQLRQQFSDTVQGTSSATRQTASSLPPGGKETSVSSATTRSDSAEASADELRAELAAMKAQMARLEALLANKSAD